MSELTLEVLQRNKIVEGMNVAGNELCNRPRFGPTERIRWQQRRIGMNVVKIFDDRERLREHLTTR